MNEGSSVLLTVSDFFEIDSLHGRLATLSACETGIIGTALPDEVVAFPSALLQAGYAGIVAALWAISDLGAALLMQRFYAVSKSGDSPLPAHALRTAQLWLRDSTNREKHDCLKRHTVKGTHKDAEKELGAAILQKLNEHPEAHSFAHPFWWAAFYMTGV